MNVLVEKVLKERVYKSSIGWMEGEREREFKCPRI